VAVFRDGLWQIRFSDDDATTTFTMGTGMWPTTVPVAGDWDGDGIDGIGTYTSATGTWTLRQVGSNSGSQLPSFVFWSGTSSSYPVVGDWDGDSFETVGVKAGGTWSLNNANDAGAADLTLSYGLATDLPMSWR
jgi:hypothetical protein